MKTLNWIQKRIFPTIIALSALSVSASAAFYSVTGLSKLFAGASFQVLIMTGSLEFAKLVIASLLYQYWSQLNKILRTYLSMATLILILITSAGIYGFLSAAYQETASKAGIVDKEVELLELKKSRFEDNRNYFLLEKKELDNSINELRNGLSNNVIQYKDKETGQIITTTSSSQRKSLERQLDVAMNSRNEIGKKIETNTDSVSTIEIKMLDIESNSEAASELGPLKYISELTNTPMNNVVNILMLVIIFVFDPLAISLVIAANFAFDKIRKTNDKTPKNKEDIEKQLRDIEMRDMYRPSDEELVKIQNILEKLELQNETEVENLENQVKLSEESPQEDNISVVSEEPNVPQIKKLIYRKRNADRNTRIDRI